ncbi:ribosome recycling factor [Spiroplasma endosymbiont of 'Nebria riversi']|uniref:ribosome recycling factor n=1 Tax=Spiroplasma endosymbiont of 'Nebria riversi' TaxID=2792084 RepID=UPI001C043806|nr:ribosome recycling factor [Spiroplasma endosymbiont of 'Nebria riversi']
MLIEALQLEIEQIKEEMEKVLESLRYELSKIHTGRANPLILASVLVDYYGSLMPVNQVAAITVVEGRQLVIKSYDRSIIKQVIAAITKANLQVSLQDQGDYIRMNVPQLTEEKRKEFVRQVKKITEEMRVRIRNLRRDINEIIKKSKLPLDDVKSYQEDIQKLTDEYIAKADAIVLEKEKELMTV